MIHYDARWTGPHGIGRFAAQVISRLEAAEPVRIGVRRLSLLDPLATTLAVRRLRSGVYFSPGFNAPLAAPIPFVFCLFDLVYLRFPAESTPLRRAYFRLVVRPAARRAFRVLTISEFSREEILAWTGLPGARVEVAGCGVADAFVPEGPRHEPGYPYFLFVGRREAHKNVAGLIAGYAASRAKRDVRLLFTGAVDEATLALVRRHGVEECIAFTPELSDEALAAYYRGAIALGFPSYYEGFGLPIAEAMACGTPVLTSGVTAIPEATGVGNALVVDPARPESIADGLDRLAGDTELRARLRGKGLARALRFSWAEVARKVAAVLRAAQSGA